MLMSSQASVYMNSTRSQQTQQPYTVLEVARHSFLSQERVLGSGNVVMVSEAFVASALRRLPFGGPDTTSQSLWQM